MAHDNKNTDTLATAGMLAASGSALAGPYTQAGTVGAAARRQGERLVDDRAIVIPGAKRVAPPVVITLRVLVGHHVQRGLYAPFFKWAKSRSFVLRNPMLELDLPTSMQASRERTPLRRATLHAAQ